jgi:hypothetical protein
MQSRPVFGEIDVPMYAVRKRRGHWAICAGESILLEFANYDEAIATARGAVWVLSGSRNDSPLFSKNESESPKSTVIAA